MFKDHFSQHASIYARYRPDYPAELFAYLASLTPRHDLVWDCGTGNGQAAISLTSYYQEVIATDPSREQISEAPPHPRITYRVEMAEDAALREHSVDLITVANALHWFNFDRFYAQAKKVLKPGGLLAAWAYKLPMISPGVDAVVRHYHDVVLGDYWLAENRLVEQGYATIPFPLLQISTPDFYCEKMMTLDTFIGFLSTWSATQRYIRMHQLDPLSAVHQQLAPLWAGGGREMLLRWKLMMKAGNTDQR